MPRPAPRGHLKPSDSTSAGRWTVYDRPAKGDIAMSDSLEARVAEALSNPVPQTVRAGGRTGPRLDFTYLYATPWGSVERHTMLHHVDEDVLAGGVSVVLDLFDRTLLAAIEDAQTGGNESGWAPGPMDVLDVDVQLIWFEAA